MHDAITRVVLSAMIFAAFGARASVPNLAAPSAQPVRKFSVAATKEALTMPLANRLETLERQGEQGYRNLVTIMFDENMTMDIRWRAVTAVGRIGRRESLPEIERALRHNDWFMRNAGLVALARIDRNAAIDWAHRLVSDKALVVRAAAVETMADLRDTSAVPVLWKKLNAPENFHRNQSLFIRRRIVEALAILAKAGDESKFIGVLNDPDQTLHPLAVMALEKTTKSVLGASKDPTPVRRELWQSWWRDQEAAKL